MRETEFGLCEGDGAIGAPLLLLTSGFGEGSAKGVGEAAGGAARGLTISFGFREWVKPKSVSEV